MKLLNRRTRLTAGRVRHLRSLIERDRCVVRPGLRHSWADDAVFDPTSFGAVVSFHTCSKCGVNDGL